MWTSAQVARRVDAAMGRIPCDLIVRNVTYLDVFNCQWRLGDISILDGFIVGLENGLKGNREIDGKGKWIVPGFVDAHVHVESSLVTPTNFDLTVLGKGTTTAICDPHELANVMGISGIEYFLNESQHLRMDLRVMLSSCVPATDYETNGAGHLTAQDLLPLKKHPRALGLAEVMNVPGLLHKSEEVLEKVAAFSDRVIDGHCPLVSGRELDAYAASGISSCHESTQLAEAAEKLRKGLSVWIREGSVAKDLKALIPLLNMATSSSIGFCTDDRNPLDIEQEGHVDHLVRSAISQGVSDTIAYRASSWSVARHYGLQRKGAVAPGYEADLVLLDDAKSCAIHGVIARGRLVSEWELSSTERKARKPLDTIQCALPDPVDLEGPEGRVHVIGVKPGSILTGREVSDSNSRGVARLSVIERYGKASPPANGYVRGFGERFQGAIASSVGHDSHNVIVVGSDTKEMATAVRVLKSMAGGFCVVKGGKPLASLPLPFGGLMTSAGSAEVVKNLKALRAAGQEVQCELAEPFLQLAFLSLPVIPSLKLTDKGLVDVEAFKLISVAAG